MQKEITNRQPARKSRRLESGCRPTSSFFLGLLSLGDVDLARARHVHLHEVAPTLAEELFHEKENHHDNVALSNEREEVWTKQLSARNLGKRALALAG
jgi:hypothetical protein